jgi:hypothetical protein
MIIPVKNQLKGFVKRTQMANKTKKNNTKATRASAKIGTRPIRNRAASVVAKGSAKTIVKATSKNISNLSQVVKTKLRSTRPDRVPRETSASSAAHRQAVRLARAPQFTYMNAPGLEDVFDVGNTVEVFCDHEQASERVRGWIKGTVVQVDNKLVAVQFRSNVFLTDGWMVPDRILWYSLTSDQIRSATAGKRGTKKVIPEY